MDNDKHLFHLNSNANDGMHRLLRAHGDHNMFEYEGDVINVTFTNSSGGSDSYGNPSHAVSSDHLNAASQVAIWLAIMVYFWLVLFIACVYRARSPVADDIEFCLVKKKVRQHEKAHKFNSSVQHSKGLNFLRRKISRYQRYPNNTKTDNKKGTATDEKDYENESCIGIEAPECTICLCTYEVGETVAWSKLKSGCTHVFHHDCIVEWAMKGNAHCPVCRTIFWSTNHKDVIQMPQDAAGGGNRRFFNSLWCGFIKRVTVDSRVLDALEGGSSNDGIVEVHTLETPNVASPECLPQPNTSSQEVRPEHFTSKEDQSNTAKAYIEAPHDKIIERGEFCVLHGLVLPPDF